MARDIGEGFVIVSDRTFRAFDPSQLSQLSHEIDRLLRELRGTPNEPELAVLQARQRKILRLNGALVVLRSHRARTRR